MTPLSEIARLLLAGGASKEVVVEVLRRLEGNKLFDTGIFAPPFGSTQSGGLSAHYGAGQNVKMYAPDDDVVRIGDGALPGEGYL